MGSIIKTRPALLSFVLTLLLGTFTHLAEAHSTGEIPASRSASPPSEIITGTVEQLVVSHRLTGTIHTYPQLRRDDGTASALSGPASETLQQGETAAVIGRQNGAHFAVDDVQHLAPPSQTGNPSSEVQIEGTLEIAHADDFANGRSAYHYHVRDDTGAITVLNATSLPSELHGGSRVRVAGTLSADGTTVEPHTITVESEPAGSISVQSGLVAMAATSNKVLVILANFNNTTAPSYTAAQAQQVMVTNSNSVANYYSEVSYGGQLLNVTVTSSWVTMNLAATCSYTSIASAANAAAQALSPSYTASNYNFVVYLFPSQGCGWAGLAYVGYPHQAFINGTGSFSTGTVAHEMGHNFGLWHAGSLSCGSATIGGSCSVSEYGDPWDTMGNQRAMHFNAMQKSRLGWIPASSVITHSSGSATYTLSPLESAGASVYAVKIPTTSSNRTYWLEFRQPIGFDAPLSSYPTNGVQVRVANPFEWSSGADDTEILDMTPGSGGGFGDSALLAGQSYLDSANGGVNIIVNSATSTAVSVTVTKGVGTATTTTALASSLNPAAPGASVTFTATVTGSSPTGTVNFKDGSSSISGCSSTVVSGSGNTRSAVCTTTALASGTHSIVASYGGDASNAASSSAALSQTINKTNSTTGLATSLTPSLLGSSVTFTATVSGSAPTGTVGFVDGGTSIAGCNAAPLGGSGNIRTATCATLGLAVGTHSITASYGGDAGNNGSTSASLSQVVNSVISGASSVWVDDAVPAGAILASDGGDGWTWVSSNPAPFSGSLAHQSNLASGEHQHYFYNATATLAVAVGDTLYAYVYLDPANPPSEVMLQWNDGSWEHRAYWGANQLGWGTDGTASGRGMGALPAAGQWVKLSVPAAQVGLEGRTLNGMAFTLYGGRATWDSAGKTSGSGGASSYQVSGTVTLNGAAFSGVSFAATNGGSCTGTDASGNYSCTVPSGWSGTVTPALSGYSFTPSSRSYNSITANQTAQSYTAGAISYQVSGTVTLNGAALGGVSLAATNGGSCTGTDASGNYSCTVPSGWSGTVTPALSGYSFTPTSRSYNSVTANQTAQSYTAGAITYQVSGTVTLNGAALGGVSFAATNGGSCTSSGGSGSYSCTVPSGWSGTVTPALSGYSFTPSSRNYSNVTADQAAQSYAATATGGGPTTVWVDDAVPAGATVASDGGDGWSWVSSNPAPFSGSLAHQSNLASGEHQHYFYNAMATLAVAVGDTLYAYVYLDPANPPSEVMLQWNDGSWEHRAYWGANQLGWGADGTAGRRNMGALPAAGQWVKLSVPASQVGLEGRTLNGMAFTLYGGRATWDSAGK